MLTRCAEIFGFNEGVIFIRTFVVFVYQMYRFVVLYQELLIKNIFIY